MPIRIADVSSDDMEEGYERRLAEYGQTRTKDRLCRFEDLQTSRERKMIIDYHPCSSATLDKLWERLSGIQSNELKNLMETFDYAVMKAVTCVINVVVYLPPVFIGVLSFNERIRQYIHGLKLFKTKGVEGVVFLADFENTPSFFAIKSPLRDKNYSLHELIVGLFGTNKLRKKIPNFAYMYGGFRCSPPLYDDKGNITAWCLNNSNPVNYILYENVENNISARKFVESCSSSEFLQLFKQVTYAIREAYLAIDFTHYDLHDENVLVRKLDRKRSIRYDTENGVEYLESDFVATIVDYGTSHFKFNDKDYGVVDLYPYSIFPDVGFPISDLYKFLMRCLQSASRTDNEDVIKEGIKIFRYFNSKESLKNALENQEKHYYALPYDQQTIKFTIDTLAKHTRKYCDCSFITVDPTRDILLNNKMTEEKVYKKIGMSLSEPVPIPDNIIEFYELYTRLKIEGKRDEYEYTVKAFPFLSAMKNHIDRMKDNLNQLYNIDKKIADGKSGLSSNMGYAIDRINYLHFLYKLGMNVANDFGDRPSSEQMRDIMRRYKNELRDKYLEYSKRLDKRSKSYKALEGSLNMI